MKKLLAIVAVLALVSFAFAQKADDTYRNLKYDKNTETKLVGVVEEVQEFDCPISQALGNHVVLKASGGNIVVHTAPVKFLKDWVGLELAKGDEIEVLGSKQKDAAGRDTLLARELVRKQSIYRFRDEKGKPIW